MPPRPERLNLAIAKRCHVSCRGCYTFFGRREPDLAAILSSVAAFVRLGIRDVTLSGGDPLTIDKLPDFLRQLRAAGVRSIKVDTVGVDLQRSSSGQGGPTRRLTDLMGATDFLGIPLDGWSNESVLLFRRGRRDLYVETIALLELLDRLEGHPRVVINTVAHRGNLTGLERIGAEVLRHRAVCHWNIFQYTATDQVAAKANRCFFVSDEDFAQAGAKFLSQFSASNGQLAGPGVAFRSSTARLGQYLLINSDGEAWLPDAAGRTVALGPVYGAEDEILQRWADTVAAFHQSARRPAPRNAVRLTGTA